MIIGLRVDRGTAAAQNKYVSGFWEACDVGYGDESKQGKIHVFIVPLYRLIWKTAE